MEDYKSNHNGAGAVSIIDEVGEEICLEEVLDGLPEDRQDKIRRIVAVAQESSSFRGPLPHPSHFEGYNNVLPGAAERILAMAEKQQAYNIEQGRNMHSLLSKGLWIALLLVIGTFAVVVLAIYRGLNDVVYVALAASVIFVAIFVLRKFPKNKMI